MSTKKNINALVGEIQTILAPVYKDFTTREQYAWWILEAITKSDKATLIGRKEIELNELSQAKLHEWLAEMTQEFMPLQYILGSVPFLDLEIIVQPPILIPRPETEEWTAVLIDRLKPIQSHTLSILDLCTGTGCIALALAKAMPKSHIWGGDISHKAVELARKNAEHNSISNATFIHADLYNINEYIESNKLFDIIVSNPPYISFDEFEELDDSVATWEDKQALVADDDGLAILEDIIEGAPDYLTYNHELAELKIPQLVVEIGYKQAKPVADYFNSFGFTDVQVHKDLEGKDRYVSGRLKKE